MSQVIDITIQQGKTFDFGVRCAERTLVYKPINRLISQAPVTLEVLDHELPNDWAINITCVKHPHELNTEYPVIASVIDKDTIEINNLIVCCKRPYAGGGKIYYYKPYDLTDYTARASIRPSIHSKEIFYQWQQVLVDQQQSAFILQIPAEITATFKWRNAIYDLEAITPSGKVISIVSPSQVIVEPEVSR